MLLATIVQPDLRNTFSLSLPHILDGEVWRLVTNLFTHDSAMHFLGNMLGFGFFAHLAVGFMGWKHFVVMLLLAAALGDTIHLLCIPEPAIGFSGLTLACIVSGACINPSGKAVFIFVIIPMWLLAAILVFIDIAGVIEGSNGVANLVHLSGAAIGFLYAKKFTNILAFLKRCERNRAHNKREKILEEYQSADELLEKVSNEGLHSLTDKERTFLKKHSENERKRQEP